MPWQRPSRHGLFNLGKPCCFDAAQTYTLLTVIHGKEQGESHSSAGLLGLRSKLDPRQMLCPTLRPIMNPQTFKFACSNCNMRELCMPIGMSDEDIARLDELVSTRRKVKRGEALFTHGEKFTSLFAIRTGFFKTSLVTEDGREQVTGFQMAGEIVGLDGIVNDVHGCDAVALEDAEVCVMPFDRIEEVSRSVPAFQHHVHKIMSREIVRENGVLQLLGGMQAEERLAAFLLNLVQRMHARGFSKSELVLRMTREEIGSYLGLKLETVSRTFSKLDKDGTVEVKQRHVRILDAAGLQTLVNHCKQRSH